MNEQERRKTHFEITETETSNEIEVWSSEKVYFTVKLVPKTFKDPRTAELEAVVAHQAAEINKLIAARDKAKRRRR